MPSWNLTFPFSAICGMDLAKKAMLCALVNPRIRAVLIRGPPGSAKTTLARSVHSICDARPIVVPHNVDDETLFGGLDIESTLKEGSMRFNKGLLHSDGQGILHLDDVNLFENSKLISILEAVANERVRLERDGISSSYDVNSTVIATMNPEELDIGAHALDRFDMCAYVDDADGRAVLSRAMRFSKSPMDFKEEFKEEENGLTRRIESARRILPLVTISDELIDIAVELCVKIGANGHRGDVAVMNAALTLAALDGRDEAIRKDVEEAAMLCLPHRRDYTPEDNRKEDERERDDRPQEQEQTEGPHENEPPDQNDNEAESDHTPPNDLPSIPEEIVFDIGDRFKVIDYMDDRSFRLRRSNVKMGRRGLVISSDRSGRQIRGRVPNGRARDISIGSTIKVAAMNQQGREDNGLAICVRQSDIREKVRQRRIGATLMFVVDASGSIGVRRRMVAVKGALQSLFMDSYTKRDKVGLMAFRRESSELIIPPTKSIEYCQKRLESLPTGGKTPLGEALLSAKEFMTAYVRTHPGEMCHIVLMTDGRGNIPVNKDRNAGEEAMEIAKAMSIPGVRWMVIDTDVRYSCFNSSAKLASALKARYFRLDNMNADRLYEGIRASI